jgi:hypothetical protein
MIDLFVVVFFVFVLFDFFEEINWFAWGCYIDTKLSTLYFAFYDFGNEPLLWSLLDVSGSLGKL